jgi:O-antigen/teichoic acid export membrane protein
MAIAPKKSIKRNYVYNLIYQLVSLLAPLITVPYLSRVFVPDQIGVYSASYSFVSYFTLFAAFGFQHYGQREVAFYQGDPVRQSQAFWEIFFCRLIPSCLSLAVFYTMYFCGAFGSYSNTVFIFSFIIIGFAFDISFFLAGNEDFFAISSLSVLTRTASIICIFLLVKSSSDLWVYCLITTLATVACFIFQWIFLPKYLKKVDLRSLNVSRHLLPSLRLFAPTLAVSLYALIDKTLLAALVPGMTSRVTDGVNETVSNANVENGFYEQADKIIKIALTLVGSLGSVMIPRNSALFQKGDIAGIRSNIYKSCEFVWLIGVPTVLGIIGIAEIAVPVFFGSGWDKTAYLLMLLSPVVLGMGFSDVFGYQFLIPEKRDRDFAIAVIVGAVINVALSAGLIFSLWSYGAAIGTIVAETLIGLIMLFMIRRDISIKPILKSSWRPWVSGAGMFAVVHALRYFVFKNQPSVTALIVLILSGVVAYFAFALLLREPLVLEGIALVKKHLFKGKANENPSH